MKLQSLAANQTVIERDGGVSIFYSYSTPVAAFVPGRGYLKSRTKYSVTTSRHVNAWTERRATDVDQSEIDALAA